ncbi:MAG: hypothetical protein KA998_05415 [Rickettsiaceae bacterium]|nr:hypothetical protein [Candidatus Paceibacterota bacterium]MBP7190655.1 hypothetical protein [Rickettsiaceae bacterium]
MQINIEFFRSFYDKKLEEGINIFDRSKDQVKGLALDIRLFFMMSFVFLHVSTRPGSHPFEKIGVVILSLFLSVKLYEFLLNNAMDKIISRWEKFKKTMEYIHPYYSLESMSAEVFSAIEKDIEEVTTRPVNFFDNQWIDLILQIICLCVGALLFALLYDGTFLSGFAPFGFSLCLTLMLVSIKDLKTI